MDTLIRKTGKNCNACYGVYGHPCDGDIVEHFTLHSQRVGELIVGGRNRYEKWIEAEFYCEKCGLSYKSTVGNGLQAFDQDKVKRIMSNSYELKLERNLIWNEVLGYDEKSNSCKPVGGTFVLWKDRSPISDKMTKVIEFYEDIHDRKILEFQQSLQEVYLIINSKKSPVLLDKSREERKRRDEKITNILAKGEKIADSGKKSKALAFVQKHIPGATLVPTLKRHTFSYPVWAQVKIKEVAVPKNAVKARLIQVLDENIEIRKYWVPADAVKTIDKK